MKLISLKPALVAVLGLALAGALVTVKAQTTNAAPAAAAAPSTPAKTSTAVKKTPYKGSITAIDASSVTVKTASASLTLAIATYTKFEFGSSKKHTPATAADFAAGDNVTGSYSKAADGSMTAVTVRKKKPAAAPAAQ